ncbi:response regulator transcription factor [Demequina sp. NBRC 110054]|uniref:response regulator transcription factor n=1 Tax=Demequina sp. NBRC 110054 TaxID=1570343 RepID=UPI000A026387|nr:response regulator transcription factor [Demequina sp. NBRC 110054]
MSRIVIIEDEERIASFVSKGLAAAGFTTAHARTGAEGFELAMAQDCDLVILDLGLPDTDGYSVLERLRGSGSHVPVIILTARTSVEDTVASLESGADDYLGKPFRFEELLARVRLRLRGKVHATEGSSLAHEGIVLDPLTRTVTVDAREVELSAREFALLAELIAHPGHVLSREQLLSRVWGYDFDPGSNVVDVYVRYLRRKLGHDRIQTVRGAGYRLAKRR